jgi:hypothetical protein
MNNLWTVTMRHLIPVLNQVIIKGGNVCIAMKCAIEFHPCIGRIESTDLCFTFIGHALRGRTRKGELARKGPTSIMSVL